MEVGLTAEQAKEKRALVSVLYSLGHLFCRQVDDVPPDRMAKMWKQFKYSSENFFKGNFHRQSCQKGKPRTHPAECTWAVGVARPPP